MTQSFAWKVKLKIKITPTKKKMIKLKTII